MKILFIAPYIPNQIRVRSYQLVRSLLQRGHEVTLLAVAAAQEEHADIEHLRDLGARIYVQQMPRWRSMANSLAALATGQSLQAAYSWHAGLAEQMSTLIDELEPEVIHVEHFRGANYGIRAKSYLEQRHIKQSGRRHSHIPVVWDSVDCISHLFQQAAQQSSNRMGRLMMQLELERTRRHEGWLVHQFNQVIVTSPTDRAALAQLAKISKTEKRLETAHEGDLAHKLNVIPNGVDLEYFVPNCANREAAQLVFSGKMSYHANVTAAIHLVKDIMPSVWVQHPDAQVWIVGKDPSSEVRALASPNGASERRVVVTGTVPDLRPYIQRATIAIAPVPYGAGIQNKVLEAMACATPVIASPQAASALQVENGRELQIAADSETFASAIVNLLSSPHRCQELGQMGRAYVERKHSWAHASFCLEEVYRKACCVQGIEQ